MRSLSLFVLVTFLIGISAQLNETSISGVLSEHNQARTTWGLKSLTYSRDLATAAQTWSESCNFKPDSSVHYGQNIAYYTKSGSNTCESEVREKFISVESCWDCETNTCRDSSDCGTYTQIIWKDTTCFGCGVSSCPAGSISEEEVDFLVCFYDVPGNVNGYHPLTCSNDKPSCTRTPQHSPPPPHIHTPPPPHISTPPPPATHYPPPPKQTSPPPPKQASPPPPDTHYPPPPPKQSSPPPPKQTSPPPPDTHYPPPPPKQSSPPPPATHYPPPPPKPTSPPPPASYGYSAVSDSEASSPTGLSLGVWIGICIGASALTAVVVGLVTFLVVRKSGVSETV